MALTVFGPGSPGSIWAWVIRLRPFGFGRPYSVGQLEGYLRLHRFQAERHVMALYAPPSQKRFWLKSAPFWEKWGHRMGGPLGAGAILLEATKQVWHEKEAFAAIQDKPAAQLLVLIVIVIVIVTEQ